MLKPLSKFIFISLIVGFFLSLSSCVNLKKATYFNEIKDTVINSSYTAPEPLFHKNDLLSISVSSLNAEASMMFNVTNSSVTQATTAAGTITQASGYLIDSEGNIRFPYLGVIKAEGKTKKILRDEITKELEDRKLLIDPIVTIRYLNYRVSILGEVRNPSVLTIPSEQVTLLEALSLAGDLTAYAQRNNVMLIREEGDQKKIVRLDLTSNDLFTSPYYYLQPNDIIYVSTNKARVASTSRVTQWLPVVLGALSLAVVAFATLYR